MFCRPILIQLMYSLTLLLQEIAMQPRPGGIKVGGNDNGAPRPGGMKLGGANEAIETPRPGGVRLQSTNQDNVGDRLEQLRKKLNLLLQEKRNEHHVETLTVEERLYDFEFELHVKDWQLKQLQEEIEKVLFEVNAILKQQEEDLNTVKHLNMRLEYVKDKYKTKQEREKYENKNSNNDMTVRIPRTNYY